VPVAFVLINTEIGSEEEVLQALKKLKGVEEAHIVFGGFDIVAKIQARSVDELKEIVTLRIRRLNKVTLTQTLFAS